MNRRRLFWQVYGMSLVLVAASTFGVWEVASRVLRDSYLRETRRHLEAKALILEGWFRGLAVDRSEEIQDVCRRVGLQTQTRITVVRANGQVVGDTEADPAHMDNHGDRPEVAAALRGEPGYSVRYSDTLRRRMMYVGYPLRGDAGVIGAVRTALSLEELDRVLDRISAVIGTAAFLIALVGAGLSLWVARKIARPLEEMREGARRFAAGDLEHRLHVGGSQEVCDLGQTLNDMAAQIQERIGTILRERNERDAVFASMGEGVVAVDMDQNIVHVNQAAARLLGLQNAASAERRTVPEAVRNPEFQLFVDRALSHDGVLEADLMLDDGVERFVQAHGTALRDADNRKIGAVIVLNDVTRVRQLERVRQDFVANVSHELKTPVTSIKGFVETLLDGAADDPAERRRFLDIIARHTQRIDSIINDLLTLSRVEYEAGQKQIQMETVRLAGVMKQALEVCESRASQKQVELRLSGEKDLECRINPALIEQAVVNLIDNAVKYSPEKGTVDVGVTRAGQEIRIAVADRGCGIERQHLSRLFERFYRADKGRSRQMGGTGLGLAIVRHILLAHQGTVDVQSEPGKGSTFTLRFPA